MKTLITAALLATAIATPSFAQPAAVTTPMAQKLIYRAQMMRDGIGILCQRLPSGPKKDQRDGCEVSIYTTYYRIVDNIRKIERGPESEETFKLISAKWDEIERGEVEESAPARTNVFVNIEKIEVNIKR